MQGSIMTMLKGCYTALFAPLWRLFELVRQQVIQPGKYDTADAGIKKTPDGPDE